MDYAKIMLQLAKSGLIIGLNLQQTLMLTTDAFIPQPVKSY